MVSNQEDTISLATEEMGSICLCWENVFIVKGKLTLR